MLLVNTNNAVRLFKDNLPNSTERVVAIGGNAELIITTVETILGMLDESPLKGRVF